MISFFYLFSLISRDEVTVSAGRVSPLRVRCTRTSTPLMALPPRPLASPSPPCLRQTFPLNSSSSFHSQTRVPPSHAFTSLRVQKMADQVKGKDGSIHYSCAWRRSSSPSCWPFAPLVGVNPQPDTDGSVASWLPQNTFTRFSWYSFMNHTEEGQTAG